MIRPISIGPGAALKYSATECTGTTLAGGRNGIIVRGVKSLLMQYMSKSMMIEKVNIRYRIV